jgi:hypothetical protein
MTRIGAWSEAFGGVIFLLVSGVPALVTAAFDRDWILLGDEKDGDELWSDPSPIDEDKA